MSGSRLTHAECRHLLSGAAFGRVVVLRDDRIVVELAELVDVRDTPVVLVPPGTPLDELCAEACADGTQLTVQTDRIDRARNCVRSVALTGVPMWVVDAGTLRACAAVPVVARLGRHPAGLRFLVLRTPHMHGRVYPLRGCPRPAPRTGTPAAPQPPEPPRAYGTPPTIPPARDRGERLWPPGPPRQPPVPRVPAPHLADPRRSRRMSWPASAAMVARARNLVRATLTDWRLTALGDHALICVSELASNAVKHAGPHGPDGIGTDRAPFADRGDRGERGDRAGRGDLDDAVAGAARPPRITVALRLLPGTAVILEVEDEGGDGHARARPALLPGLLGGDGMAPSGRGLRLVRAFSDDFGWAPLPTGGTNVWCAFDLGTRGLTRLRIPGPRRPR